MADAVHIHMHTPLSHALVERSFAPTTLKFKVTLVNRNSSVMGAGEMAQ